MRGQLKFVDGKTGNWGFIVPEDGTADLHFVQKDVSGAPLTRSDAGVEVEFEVEETATSRRAKHVRIVASEVPFEASSAPSPTPAPIPAPRPVPPGAHSSDDLVQWSYFVFADYTTQGGKQVKSALTDLASMALEERWYFGTQPDPKSPHPILANYLKYTYFRLRREGKISEATGQGTKWASFNTGLVDKLYDPIFALFKENDAGFPQPWRFHAFCVPGKGNYGKQLTAVFDPLPEPASYFESNFDMLLDTSKEIHVDYDHVILDGVSRDRFPPDLLAQHPPKNFAWADFTAMERNERQEFLTKLAKAIEADVQTMRSIKRRLEDAKLLAEKRTKWNYKTAIPQYFPRQDVMSLLLPLAIVDDERVDLALVVTRNPSGSYQGRTVFPLDWAYQNARLVCRPDSDWLVTERVSATSATASPPADA
jgi:cold shock CspA family protein